jgi:hypothetical protein
VPRGFDDVPVAPQALAGRAVVGPVLAVLVGRALPLVLDQRHGDDAEAGVTEVQQVAGRGGGAAAVVDPDVPRARQPGAVDDDEGQPAVDDGREPALGGDVAVTDHRVDERDAGDGTVRPAGDEDQGEVLALAHLADALEEQDRRGIAEPERHRCPVDQAERVHAAPRERRRERVGPRVAQLACRAQHAAAQARAQALGVVVGVGHGGPGDAEGTRHGRERDPPARASTRLHTPDPLASRPVPGRPHAGEPVQISRIGRDAPLAGLGFEPV